MHRSLRIGLLLVAILGWPAPGKAAAWMRYDDGAVSVDIPTEIFAREEAATSGKRFSSDDRRASLSLRNYPPTLKSPAAFLAELGPPPGIVYQKIGRNFFVVSSFRNANIWYNRCNFSGSGVGCVLLNYPAAEKRRWDAPVTRISNSLRVR